MVIASDFESRSYTSLFVRFGRQLLLFIVGILVASGIMYGIEKNYSMRWHDEEEEHEASYFHWIENFLNTTGASALEKFTHSQNINDKATREFIHLMHKLAYQSDENQTDYWYNYHTDGMTFLQAFALIVSTITTVGWGHVTPLTDGGKAFTCVVAILGIPLTLMMVISGSQLTIRLSKSLVRKVFGTNRINLLYKPFLALCIFSYIVLTSAIIAKLEYFDYSDAIWYSIMALTTVGLGDVVQMSAIHPERVSTAAGVAIFQLVWLVFGFIFIGALAMAFVYDNWGDGRHNQFHQIFRQKDEELVDNENED